MRNITKLLSLGIMLAFSTVTVHAADRATKEEAVALVDKAVAFLKKNGEAKAFEEFNKSAAEKGEFVNQDLYIFCYDTQGNMHCIGNGNAKKMVGKPLIDMRDAEGVYLVRGLIKATEATGKGWFDYKFPNPATKNVEPKSGYCERVKDKLICSGIYKVTQ